MPRSLSQRSLQAFRLTVLTGSVSAAAGTMGRTQPAVSRLLKELERDVGFRLFDRIRGRLQPTNEARLFFDEVERSFIGLDRIASIAGEIRSGGRGTIATASLPAAASILPRAMRLFTERRPDAPRVARACGDEGSGIKARQSQQQRHQATLLHRHGRLGEGEPLPLALPPLRSVIQQPLHPKRKHVHPARHGAAASKALQVAVGSNGHRGDLADKAVLRDRTPFPTRFKMAA